MVRTLLLTVHVAGVAAWLGANFVQLVATRRLAATSTEVAVAWNDTTRWLGQRYYIAAGAVIAITGVLLVLDGDWSWSAGFVAVGITVVVVGGALGGLVFSPLGARRTEALERGDDDDARRVLDRITVFAVFDTLLVLTAVLAMIDKWRA